MERSHTYLYLATPIMNRGVVVINGSTSAIGRVQSFANNRFPRYDRNPASRTTTHAHLNKTPNPRPATQSGRIRRPLRWRLQTLQRLGALPDPPRPPTPRAPGLSAIGRRSGITGMGRPAHRPIRHHGRRPRPPLLGTLRRLL